MIGRCIAIIYLGEILEFTDVVQMLVAISAIVSFVSIGAVNTLSLDFVSTVVCHFH